MGGGIISIEVRTLVSLGYVFNPMPLHATLSQKAMNVMERRPQPGNYDEFLDMFNNPQKPFGEPVKIEGYKESFWKKWHTAIYIGGAIASIIGVSLYVYNNYLVVNSP